MAFTPEQLNAMRAKFSLEGEGLSNVEIAVVFEAVKEINLIRGALNDLVGVLNQLRAFHGLAPITASLPLRTKTQVINAIRAAVINLEDEDD